MSVNVESIIRESQALMCQEVALIVSTYENTLELTGVDDSESSRYASASAPLNLVEDIVSAQREHFARIQPWLPLDSDSINWEQPIMFPDCAFTDMPF